MPVFPEILSRLLILSEPIVTFTISALGGTQVQVCQLLFHLFQHYGAIQAQVCPKNGVVYGSE
jgi:hypothetical protein